MLLTLCFLLSYILSNIALRTFKIDYISQLNLNVFTFVISCLATISMAVILFASNGKLSCFKVKVNYEMYLLMSMLGIFAKEIVRILI
jgi:hypothetical protein